MTINISVKEALEKYNANDFRKSIFYPMESEPYIVDLKEQKNNLFSLLLAKIRAVYLPSMI
jgi:hypothetical protein